MSRAVWNGVEDLAVSGSLVFLHLRDELLLLDASDPAAPELMGRARSDGDWGTVWAEGARAYVVSGGILRILDFSSCVPARARFRRGDCNGDGEVNTSDPVCIFDWLFAGEGRSECTAATNANGDDAANITDATYLLNHLFSGGPAPVAPFPDCGPGTLPADTELGCANPSNCQ